MHETRRHAASSRYEHLFFFSNFVFLALVVAFFPLPSCVTNARSTWYSAALTRSLDLLHAASLSPFHSAKADGFLGGFSTTSQPDMLTTTAPTPVPSPLSAQELPAFLGAFSHNYSSSSFFPFCFFCSLPSPTPPLLLPVKV